MSVRDSTAHTGSAECFEELLVNELDYFHPSLIYCWKYFTNVTVQAIKSTYVNTEFSNTACLLHCFLKRYYKSYQ